MSLADSLGIPSNLRRIYLPFTPKNNPGYFTYKRDVGVGNPDIITPFSKNVERLINLDSGVSFVHDQKMAKLQYNNFLKYIPSLQIREYVPDAKLTQCFKWIDALTQGVKDGMLAAGDVNVKEMFTMDNIRQEVGKLKTALTDKFLQLISDSALGLETVVGGLGPTNFTDMKFPVGKDAGYAVLYAPFLLYYRLNTTTTTNVYELPFDINTTNELMHSDGTYGWGGTGAFSSGRFALGSNSEFSKLLGLNTLKVNVMPSFDPDGNQQGKNFTITFNLINDTAEGTAENYIMLHNLFGNNRWLQYGFVQTSSALYDVKIPGANRYFMCKGQFTCNSVGGFRTPSNKVCNAIVGSMSNSKGGVKGKDWYPDVRTALEEQAAGENGEAAIEALADTIDRSMADEMSAAADAIKQGEEQFIEASGMSVGEITEAHNAIIEKDTAQGELTVATMAVEEQEGVVSGIQTELDGANTELEDANQQFSEKLGQLQQYQEGNQRYEDTMEALANSGIRDVQRDLINATPQLKDLQDNYNHLMDEAPFSPEAAAAKDAFDNALNDSIRGLTGIEGNYTDAKFNHDAYVSTLPDVQAAGEVVRMAEGRVSEVQGRLDTANQTLTTLQTNQAAKASALEQASANLSSTLSSLPPNKDRIPQTEDSVKAAKTALDNIRSIEDTGKIPDKISATSVKIGDTTRSIDEIRIAAYQTENLQNSIAVEKDRQIRITLEKQQAAAVARGEAERAHQAAEKAHAEAAEARSAAVKALTTAVETRTTAMRSAGDAARSAVAAVEKIQPAVDNARAKLGPLDSAVQGQTHLADYIDEHAAAYEGARYPSTSTQVGADGQPLAGRPYKEAVRSLNQANIQNLNNAKEGLTEAEQNGVTMLTTVEGFRDKYTPEAYNAQAGRLTELQTRLASLEAEGTEARAAAEQAGQNASKADTQLQGFIKEQQSTGLITRNAFNINEISLLNTNFEIMDPEYARENFPGAPGHEAEFQEGERIRKENNPVVKRTSEEARAATRDVNTAVASGEAATRAATQADTDAETAATAEAEANRVFEENSAAQERDLQARRDAAAATEAQVRSAREAEDAALSERRRVQNVSIQQGGDRLDKVFNGSSLGQTGGDLDSSGNIFVQREYFKIPDAYKVTLTFTSLLPDTFNNFLYGFRNDNLDPVFNYIKEGKTVDKSVFEKLFDQLRGYIGG